MAEQKKRTKKESKRPQDSQANTAGTVKSCGIRGERQNGT